MKRCFVTEALRFVLIRAPLPDRLGYIFKMCISYRGLADARSGVPSDGLMWAFSTSGANMADRDLPEGALARAKSTSQWSQGELEARV